LLRPDAATNNAFTYCLIEAAQRCEIDVLLPCAMSNHYHAVIFDRCGGIPGSSSIFIRCSHAARMRCADAGRTSGRRSKSASCTLVDRDAVMDKLVYTAANPVQDHLVDRVHHWPGGVP
jgi:REP element-mobilizing transposase RayT